MLYIEWVERVRLEAQRGSEQAELSQLDTQPIIEAIQPSVFQTVGENCAADPRKRSLMRRSLTISMADGEGEIPAQALTKYMEDATFFDPADLSKTYSWVREFQDFMGPLDSRLGYFNVQGESVLLQREPGEVYEPGFGFSDDMLLIIPCVPVRPASATDTIDCIDEVSSDLVDVGAAMLRGELAKVSTAGT